MDLKKNDIDLFFRVTNFDLKSLLADWSLFVDNDLPRIESFFRRDITRLDSNIISRFEDLKLRVKECIETIRNKKSVLSSFRFWEILELVEDIKTKVDVVDNFNKFLRSSIINSTTGSNIVIDYTRGQNESLENISRNLLSDDDFDNSWVGIALSNNKREEDYDNTGGDAFKIEFTSPEQSELDSIIDVMTSSDKLYGIDLSRDLEFVDDDLLILSYFETFKQSVDNAMSLKKGQNPEFPFDGIDSRIAIGYNYSALSLPVIFRQIIGSVSKDDSIKSFKIINIRNDQDALFIEYETSSKSGDFITSVANF